MAEVIRAMQTQIPQADWNITPGDPDRNVQTAFYILLSSYFRYIGRDVLL